MRSANTKIYSVVVVDDSYDDRFVLRRALERFPRFHLVAELEDGEDAIAYLSGKAALDKPTQHPLPDLMLLDLKMPKKTGFEVLNWLQSRSFLQLTVIVLSGSNLGEDIGASLALGAHGFWTKTADMKKQDAIAREIEALLDKRHSQVSKSGTIENLHSPRLASHIA
jgi:CheY-like chemotaxis protein